MPDIGILVFSSLNVTKLKEVQDLFIRMYFSRQQTNPYQTKSHWNSDITL